jgi:serine/threonine-protein kinase
MIEVGRGAEATVYAKVERSNKTGKVELFAVRVLRKRQKERVGAEYMLRLCMMTPHEHVVRIMQADPCSGLLVLEFLPGGTLAEELVCGDISTARAEAVVRQVLGGLSHLHAHGFMHGDVSPSNVLLDKNGGCKLTDYFVDSLSGSTVCATPSYLAPEALNGRAVFKSDVWSVGCLALAVSGMPPWQEDEVRLDDGTIIDVSSAGALLYHLASRDIAMRGPPEYAACDDKNKCVFSDVWRCVFICVDRRVSSKTLLEIICV